MKSAALAPLLLFLTTLPVAAQVGFDDLRVGSSTGDGSRVIAAPETSRARGQRLLDTSGALLARCLENYQQMVLLATEQSDSGRNKYSFADKSAYRSAGRLADALGTDMLEAQGALRTAESLIGAMELQGEPAWALELRLEWTSQVTVFDQLRDWCQRRVLRYDTWAFADQETRAVLRTAAQLEALELPRRTGVRAETHLATSQAEPLASRWIAAADARVAEASDAHRILDEQRLRPQAGEGEATRMGWTLYRYNTVVLFDGTVRRQAVRYAAAMLRAKAALNAAILATEAPTGRFSEKNHTDLRGLMMRYGLQVQWGDRTFLEVPGTLGAKRKHWLFDGSGFHDQHRVRTRGLESRYMDDVLEYAARYVRQSS